MKKKMSIWELEQVRQAKARKVLSSKGIRRMLEKHPDVRAKARIERKLSELSRNIQYYGQSPYFGERNVTSVTLLDGTVVQCHIPMFGDVGMSDDPIWKVLGGINVAKWVRSAHVSYVKMECPRGYSIYAVEPTPVYYEENWGRYELID